MTPPTMTPDARKILRKLRDHGPASIDDIASLYCPRPPERGHHNAAKYAWSDAAMRAQLALSELEQAGRVVRVITRRDVLFMVPDDAASLIEETRKAIADIGDYVSMAP